MEVILKKYISGLGEQNDIVKVKAGYARNYLIPKQFAILATESERKILAENIKQQAHKEKDKRENAQEIADKLQSLELKINVKTSSKGKLFGSVTNTQLTEVINKNGFDIDRRKVILSDVVKNLGSYTAKINIYKDIDANVNFEVVPIKISK